jgi:hypothetical protein
VWFQFELSAQDTIVCYFQFLVSFQDFELSGPGNSLVSRLVDSFRRTEEMSIPLQTKLQFLENVVILSFGNPPPFTSETRNEWIRTRTQTFFPTLSEAVVDELMLLSNTINTLREAREERQFLLQEGDLI